MLTDAALPRHPQAADSIEHQVTLHVTCAHFLVVKGSRKSILLGVFHDAEVVLAGFLARCFVPEVILVGGTPVIKMQAPDPAMAKYGRDPARSMVFIRQLYRLLNIITQVRPLVIPSSP